MDMNQKGLQKEATDNRQAAALVPPVDIWEDGEGIVLKADLPGVGKDALNIGVDGDTLYATNQARDVYKRLPNAESWTKVYGGSAREIVITAASTILLANSAGPTRIVRSDDGGQTWTAPPGGDHTFALFQSPATGDVYAGPRGSERMRGSSDDGQTWGNRGFVPDAADPAAAKMKPRREDHWPRSSPPGVAPACMRMCVG